MCSNVLSRRSASGFYICDADAWTGGRGVLGTGGATPLREDRWFVGVRSGVVGSLARWLGLLVGLAAVSAIAPAASATTSGWVFDSTFATNFGGGLFPLGTLAVVRQPDGRLVLGGDFRAYIAQSLHSVMRLNSDGTPDTVFNTALGGGADGNVGTVALQADGKILSGGTFSSFNGVTAGGLVRLNGDGTVDTAFATALGTGFNACVLRVAVQADGRILVGGQSRRLHPVQHSLSIVTLRCEGLRPRPAGSN